MDCCRRRQTTTDARKQDNAAPTLCDNDTRRLWPQHVSADLPVLSYKVRLKQTDRQTSERTDEGMWMRGGSLFVARSRQSARRSASARNRQEGSNNRERERERERCQAMLGYNEKTDSCAASSHSFTRQSHALSRLDPHRQTAAHRLLLLLLLLLATETT